MQDERKSKQQLVEELAALRAELSASEAKLRGVSQELAASEDAFAAISEQTLMAIVVVQDFRIVYANRKYAEISEYSVEEILAWSSRDLLKIVHPEDVDFVIGQLAKKQAGETEGIVPAYCYRGVTRSGKVRWLEQHSKTVSYRGRSADLVAMVDITERHEAEERVRGVTAELERRVEERTAELLHANSELRELDRLKDSFVSSISHELRTPLVSAKGYTELLLERETLGARQHEWVTRIHSSLLRLQAIIDDLLDISKLQSGSMTLSVLPVDLAVAIEKSTQTLRPKLREKRIQVKTAIPPDLPLVLADPHKLQSVLLNLIDNAGKFSAEGSPIEVRCAVVEAAVVVSIQDRGIGIPPADLERIFTRFYQVDSSSTRLYGGAGIGLALVKDIIEMLAGRIWVESAVGQGSRFSFSLPAASVQI